jgi:hypothetical protein
MDLNVNVMLWVLAAVVFVLYMMRRRARLNKD